MEKLLQFTATRQQYLARLVDTRTSPGLNLINRLCFNKLWLENGLLLRLLFNKIGVSCGTIHKDRTCYVLNVCSSSKNDLKIYKFLYENSEYFYPRKRLFLKSNIFKDRI